MSNTIPDELRQAYASTHYCVFRPAGELVLRVNESSKAADKLLAEYSTTTAAFITAWNPGSEVLSEAENAKRDSQLKGDLERAGYRFLSGAGRDPEGVWRPEQSLLVPGMQLPEATELALKFGQHAYLYIAVAKPAELVWVTNPGPDSKTP